MQITNVKIRKVYNYGQMRALVSITLDGVFAVHDLKVIEGIDRLFVAMPSRKTVSGEFIDVVHPIDPIFRKELESTVIVAYQRFINKLHSELENGKGEILL